jgi:glycosyltransferase involved in cell wall biosynthesis
VWIVLDAAEELAARGADARFVIVGDGPLAAEFRAERDRRGLANVEIRPGVPVSDVAEVLLNSHALLIPLGKHEMLGDFIPSKLYDAMAVGRPALVAASGESAALTEATGCGVVVPPEDGRALADAITGLEQDPVGAAEMAKRGRAAAPEYARSRAIERLEEVLLNSSRR